MFLPDLTDSRLQSLYDEYWGLMQGAEICLHEAMRNGADDLAAACRQQVKSYRQKAEDVKAEMERRKNE